MLPSPQQGRTFAGIAKQLDILLTSAKRHALRKGNTRDLPRSGRPTKIQPSERKHIKLKARSGTTATKLRDHSATKRGVDVVRQTVVNVLKGGRNPLSWGVIHKAKVLREANRLKRISFCQSRKNDPWRHTIFIDSKFVYVTKAEAKGWQDAASPKVFPLHSPVMVFHFFAAVSHGHKSQLVFVPPTRGALGTDPKEKVTF